jgi:hypothetical protein
MEEQKPQNQTSNDREERKKEKFAETRMGGCAGWRAGRGGGARRFLFNESLGQEERR